MIRNWKERTDRLRNVMEEAVASGEECGCQLVVYEDGERVVDLCAGFTAPDRRIPIRTDALFPIFSVGKGVMATAFHRLVEQGKITYDTRIADLWPEFGCNGKEEMLVWHILTHRGALFDLPPCESQSDLADWGKMADRMAHATPKWTPGTICRYHPITYAWLLGEIAHRADGRSFQEILRQEVIEPLHLEHSLFFGTTAEAEERFVPIDLSAVPETHTWHTDFMHDPVIRRACIPSANGVANAESIARHYAALIAEVDGVRLLKPETVSFATRLRRAEDDPPRPGEWSRFGLGWALSGPEEDLGSLFGHGGAAGSEGFADRRTHLALGLTRNRILSTMPVIPLRDRISEILGLPVRHW